MKKTIVFLLLIFVSSILLRSQENKIGEAFNLLKEGELLKAKSLIDDLIDNVENKSSASAWYCKAIVYHSIYESDDLKIKNTTNNALNEAFYAYKNTMQYDKSKQFQSDLTKRLNVLANQFSNKGVNEYNQNKFLEALESFENNLEINNLSMFMRTDSSNIYNAAISAYFSKNYDKAIKYYEKLIEIKYAGAEMYFSISEVYRIKNDIDNSLMYLSKGIEAYPNKSVKLFNQLINSLIDLNRKDEAINLLENQINKGNRNADYFMTIADLLNENGNYEKIENLCNSAIEIDNNNFKAYFKLGLLNYNKAIMQNDYVNTLTDEIQFKAEKIKVDVFFKKSLPNFEMANKLNPKDKNTLNKLKFLYKRFNNQEKYNLVLKQLGVN